MATHSSILAWRIPIDREAWQATSPWGRKELDMTEELSLSHSLTHSLESRSVLVFPSCSAPFLGICSGLSHGEEIRGSLQVLTMLDRDRRYLSKMESRYLHCLYLGWALMVRGTPSRPSRILPFDQLLDQGVDCFYDLWIRFCPNCAPN